MPADDPWCWRRALERALRYWYCTGRRCRVSRDPEGRWRSTVLPPGC